MPDYISVTNAGPTNVSVSAAATNVVVEVEATPSATVVDNAANPMPTPGVQVSATKPPMVGGGIWIQTFDNGDVTMWIEDGK